MCHHLGTPVGPRTTSTGSLLPYPLDTDGCNLTEGVPFVTSDPLIPPLVVLGRVSGAGYVTSYFVPRRRTGFPWGRPLSLIP